MSNVAILSVFTLHVLRTISVPTERPCAVHEDVCNQVNMPMSSEGMLTVTLRW